MLSFIFLKMSAADSLNQWLSITAKKLVLIEVGQQRQVLYNPHAKFSVVKCNLYRTLN